MAQVIAQKTVIKGASATVSVRLRDENDDAFDLTTATAITASFSNTDGSTLVKSLAGATITVVSATLGKISISLAEADTLLLKAGVQSFQVAIDQGASIRFITQLVKGLNVVASLF